MGRTFEDKPATRAGGVPLLLGLVGPSYSGKTTSALRVGTGMVRVTGGELFLIDTENHRSRHYADRYKFRHVPFDAPFGSLDYMHAIEHCVNRGAKVIIIDSMSHEHEGTGGLLEQHEAECERLQKEWRKTREKVQMSAWGVPKRNRRTMINRILQHDCHFIFCFRAKEKMLVIPGRNPENQGYMPIAGDELFYEMTASALLLPGAGGVPCWQSALTGEKIAIKRPQQFIDIMSGPPKPLDEGLGEAMAKWASGESNQAHAELSAAIVDASDMAQLESLIPRLAAAGEQRLVTPAELQSLRSAFKERKIRLESDVQQETEPTDDDGRDPDNPDDY